MASLAYLIEIRGQYLSLKNSIGNVTSQINRCINSIADATRITEFYTFNDNSADNNEIIKIKDKLSTSMTTTNSLISLIDNKILELNQSIKMEEERMAREAAEAAERARLELLNQRNW